MPSQRPSANILLALLVSLLLHAGFLGWPALKTSAAPRPSALQATLMPILPPVPAEPLLKNTLAPQHDKPAPPTPASPPPPKTGAHGARPAKLDKPKEEAAQRKLAEHLYYPEEAVDQGLEGEVRLLLRLDAAGNILSVDLAAGSGHAILDRAAVAAAKAMGGLPDAGVRDFILPVIFRLQ